MNALRRHSHRHRWWAAALIVAALLIEILVPAGYMPAMTNGAFLVRPCAGRNAPIVMAAVADASDHAAHGDHKHDPDHGKAGHDNADHGNAEIPCVFSSLSAPTLPMTDAILLAIAIAFILTAAFHLEEQVPRRGSLYLRPPSQGPPSA